MKVKICGVCRPDDALAAVAAGADYVGVIFAAGSPRTQTAAAAAAIYSQIGSCLRAGVFANQAVDDVCELATSLELDVVQLHGRENAEFASAISDRTGCAVWKTVWLRSPADLDAAIIDYGAYVDGLLLDAARRASYGGTGTTFDWALAADARALLPGAVELIVAGGLRPDNVREAIAIINPDVVDVASGVEATICQKSPHALHAFVRNAKS